MAVTETEVTRKVNYPQRFANAIKKIVPEADQEDFIRKTIILLVEEGMITLENELFIVERMYS